MGFETQPTTHKSDGKLPGTLKPGSAPVRRHAYTTGPQH